MRYLTTAVRVVFMLALSAGLAVAQSTTGTVSGRVIDTQERSVPGVTVTVASENLQGVRTSATSESGDYIVTLLPPGQYTISFELSGFQTQQRSFSLAPTQLQRIDVMLGLAPVSEIVDVSARSASVLAQTSQVAIQLPQDMMVLLPTNRDLNAAILLAPSVHASGPNGAYSIAGAMSFENLFLVNGVTVNENLRGQPHDLYIEDAIEETTVASAGISAEYGRFSGGVVNVITKSGGNSYGGSFRTSLANDRWRSLTPFVADSRRDQLEPTYEYTFGGPLLRDRLWFFAAGRWQDTSENRTLAVTNLAHTFSNALRRYEAKTTYSLTGGQRFEGAYIRSSERQRNSTLVPPTAIMDRNSLVDPRRIVDLFTAGYHGVLSPTFAIEARVSVRNETLKDIGANAVDLVRGTMLLDGSRGLRRYWAPTFCGACGPEARDNQSLFIRASRFFPSSDYGAHEMVFGYETFNDRRIANNHQTGSDYRIYGSSAIIDGETITPVFRSDGTTVIQWNPIAVETKGTNFRTHSAFINDNWRVTSRITANIGLRFDRNHGLNGTGDRVADDQLWSPRVGVLWDAAGNGRWSISGSVARYAASLANTIADASSVGGQPDTYPFVYQGPSINDSGAPTTPTAEAIQRVFDWFFANGGTGRPLNGGAYNVPTVVRGVTPQIRNSLKSPNSLEYAGGIARLLGARGTARADFIYREYHDFYVSRTDMATGTVTDKLGRAFDLTLLENSDALSRRYAGVSAQATYRAPPHLDVGATYTLSRTWGNVDGETASGGPSADAALQYPEYKRSAWNTPQGDLSIDQRHRGRIWAIISLPWIAGASLSALQIIESGVPYGAVAVSGVNPRPHVANPGYISPPTAVVYYMTARDAFRTQGQQRTDVAANYVRKVSPGGIQVFGHLQIVNLFNQSQLCGCGQSVFQNGGAVNAARIDQTVRVLQPFNPFTTAPQEGVHWAKGTDFGRPVTRFAYTSPRTLRLSFGVRF